jgi:hypothetical protein
MDKKSGSGIRIRDEQPPDHIFECLEPIFWVKILKFFDADPGSIKLGSGMEKIRIRDKHPGSATQVSRLVFTEFLYCSPDHSGKECAHSRV